MFKQKINRIGFLSLAITVILFIALFFWDTVFAQLPQEIFLQARVTKKDKTILAGPHRFTFRLYDASSGGSSLWSESQDLSVDELGIISCYLGSAASFPSALDFNDAYHLSIEVDGEGEMTPRLKVAPAPYALNSYRLGGHGSEKYLRSDVAQTMTGPFTLNSYFVQNYTGIGHDAMSITYAPAGSSALSALNITSGANVTGPAVTVSQGGTGDFVDLKAGGTTRFKVDINGNATLAGVPYVWPAVQGAAATYLRNDGSGNLSWLTVAVGSSAWSDLNDPSTDLSLAMGANTTTFTYNNNTGTSDLFNFIDSASNSGTGYLVNIQTASSSSLKPIRIRSAGTDALAILSTGNVGIGTTNPQYKLDVTGDARISNALNMNSTKITSLATPTADYDASTKKYVDDTIAGLGTLGDITSIGDVNLGDAFTSGGTQGTSLWFYDADGRGQLTRADLSAVRTWTLPDNSGTIPVTASWPLSISADGTISLGHNTTNLKITSDELNTIQDIATASTPTFGGISTSGASYLATASGNIGIGMTNPSEKLDVAGNLNVSGTSSAASLNIGALSGVLKATAGAVSGSATTTDVPEGANLYYLTSRARSAISSSGPVTYDSGTGVVGLTTPLANTYGGTGQNSSGWSGVVKVTSGTWSVATGGTDYENPLTFNFPLTRAGDTVGIGYNSTNLKITANELNTIQDLATTSTPSFGGITTNGASYFAATSGNVGIGLTNPGYKLDVSGDGYFTGNLTANNFYGNIAPGGVAGGWIEDSGNNKVFTSNLNYNVGIGKTNPTEKLDITGNLKVSGTASLYSLDMNSAKITNLATPTADYEASTKKYVDDSITGSGLGDITDVGDVTGGVAFTSGGTQGTSLWFYDADGRGQLTRADLSAVRTWTLPDNSGTIPVAASWPLSISADGTISLGHNTTNLKITSDELNTIQDIATASTPTFGGLTVSGLAGMVKATAGVLGNAVGGSDYENPLTFSFPLTRGGNTVGLGYNSTNLKLTSDELNTIQDIATASTPIFGGITTNGASYFAATSGNVGIGNTAPQGILDVGTTPGRGLIVNASGNVGIGVTNPGAPLAVLGKARLGNAATTPFATYNTATVVGIKHAVSGVNDDVNGLFIDVTSNIPSNVQTAIIGATIQATDAGTGGNTGMIYGIDLYTKAMNDLAGTEQDAFGIAFSHSVAASKHLRDAYGFSPYAYIAGTQRNWYGFQNELLIDATGSLGGAYGVYLKNPNVGGSLTNNYGLYIENLTAGSTRNYSIFSAGGKSYFGGNVGIGTSNPLYDLDVSGNGYFTGNVTAANFYGNIPEGGGYIAGGWVDDGTTVRLAASSDNVGIGKSNPTEKLDITGNLKVSGTATTTDLTIDNLTGVLKATNGVVTPAQGANNYVTRWTSTSDIGTGVIYDNATNVGIGNTAPQTLLDVGTTPGKGLMVLTSGNVGIGTTNPTQKLDVTGNLKVSGTSSTANLSVGSLTGILQATSGAVSTAVAGTDYENPLTFNFPLTRAGNTVGIGYNSTNLKLTVNELNTIQDIATASTPSFGGITATGNAYLATTNANNVGIGSSSPSAKLFIKATGTTAGFAVRIQDNNANDKVTVLDNGNVGIGTTNPLKLLQLANSSASIAENLSLLNFAGAAIGNGAALTFDARKNNANIVQYGKIGMVTTDTGNSTYKGDIVFYNASGTGPAETMRVTSGGYVGIGTTSPSQTLEVAGTVSMGGFILSSTAPSGFVLTTTGSGAGEWQSLPSGAGGWVDNGSTIELTNAGDSVGIGTYPGYKLTVNGDIKVVTGGIYFPDGSYLTSSTIGGSAISISNNEDAVITADADDNGTGAVQFKIDGTVAMVIANDKKVGMGVASPVAKLDIKSHGTGSALALRIADSSSVDRLVVQSDGNLGLGTTAPTGKIQIKSAGSGTGFTLRTQSSAGADKVVILDNGNLGLGTTAPAGLLSIKDKLVADIDVDDSSSALVYKFDTTNNLASGGAKIISFRNAGAEKAFIDKDGKAYFADNVGIGTSSTGYKLTVAGDGYFSGNLTATNFYGNIPEGGGYIAGGWVDDGTTVRLASSTDNVGIGKSNPTEKLDITGNLKVSGTSTSATLNVTGLSPSKPVFTDANRNLTSAGMLGVDQGGSGANTLTGILKGNGTSAFTGLTGSANYTARWTDANTIGTGALYDNNTNVGVGLSNPQEKLDVNGGVAISGNSVISATSVFQNFSGIANTQLTSSNLRLNNSAGVTIENYAAQPNATLTIATGNNSGTDILLSPGGSDKMVVKQGSGNVGIGTTAPIGLLQVGTSATAPGLIVLANGNVGIGLTNPVLDLEVGGSIGIPNGAFYQARRGTDNTLRSLIGFASGLTTVELYGGHSGGTTPLFRFYDSGVNDRFTILGNGNVGIGTTAPVGLLQVGTAPANPGLIVLANGNVGLGTTLPGYKLTVAGDGYFTGNVTATNFYGNIPEGGGYYAGGWTDQGTIVRLQTSSDNVGIGNSSPAAKLDVTGSLIVSGTTTTQNLTLDNLTGVLKATSGAVTTANGVQHMVTRWTDANNIGTGVLYDNATNVGIGNTAPQTLLDVGTTPGKGLMVLTNGNVGIGTTNPFQKLDVAGTINATMYRTTGNTNTYIATDGTGGMGVYSGYLLLTGGGTSLYVQNNANVNGNLGIGTSSPLGLLQVGTSPTAPGLIVLANGNVGLGTSNPLYDLDVSGNGYFTGNVTATNFYGNIPEGGGYYAGGWTDQGTVVRLQTSSDNVGIGTSAPGAAKLAVIGGNVGIGTTNPGAVLDVQAGSINTSSTYQLGGATIMSNPGTENLFVGINSGIVNAGSNNSFIGYGTGLVNTSGSDNTFVGRRAGYSTVGTSGNTFIGSNAGSANVDDYCTFIGAGAGQANTSGYVNTFVGNQAGVANTTGDYNTFLGRHAGEVNTQGSNNTFLGRHAGASNTIGGGITCIGTNADVAANNLSNATAIGNNALIGASNSMVLGATDVNVGIGTTAPTAKLNIRGSGTTSNFALRIADSLGTDRLVVLDNGNVGIGVVAPSQKLGIAGNIGFSGADGYIYSADMYNLILSTGDVNGASDGIDLRVDRDLDIGETDYGNMLVVRPAGLIVGVTTDGSGYVTGPGAYNFILRSGDVNGSDDYFALDMDTDANVGVTNYQHMLTFRDTGNVGIGTASPLARTHILNTSTVPTDTLRIQTAGSSTNFALRISNTAAAELLTVLDNGNIGLGTTGPAYDVDVTGDGRFTGNVTATNFYGNIPEGGGYYAGGWTDQGTVVRLQTSSDNVGIGTSAPGTAKLAVMSGNVGIGTTAPAAGLDVVGPSGEWALSVQGGSGGQAFVVNEWGQVGVRGAPSTGALNVHGQTTIYDAGAGNYANPILTLNVDAAQTGNLLEFIKNGTTITAFTGNGNVGIGTSSPVGLLQVGTNPAFPGLIVLPNGNVGIGTTNPSVPLSFGEGLGPLITFYDAPFANDHYGMGRAANDFQFYLGGFVNDAFTFRRDGYDGAELMRIRVDGNVGIATSAPAARLDIRGTGTTSNFALRIADSLGTDKLVVLDNGNVGIGTTAPGHELAVKGGDAVTEVAIYSDNDHFIDLWSGDSAGGGGEAPAFAWDSSQPMRFGTWSTLTNVGSWIELIRFQSDGNVGIGTDCPSARAHIQNISIAPTDTLRIQTAGSGTSFALRITNTAPAELLTVLDNGNIGIGTTGPAYDLDVSGDGRFTGNVTATNFYGNIPEGGGYYAGGWTDEGAVVRLQTSSDNVGIGTSTPGSAKLAVIGGNVGIGTTAPNDKLEIAGIVRIANGGADSNFISIYGDTNTDAYTFLSGEAGNNGFFDLGVYDTSLGWSDPNAKLRVDASTVSLQTRSGGNVGIGTTAPLAKLQIDSSGGDGLQLYSTSFNAKSLGLLSGASSPNRGYLTIGDGTGWRFHIATSGLSPLVTFQDNGNVGIGTTVPLALLQVGTSPTPGLFVTSGGNVGIGTTGPAGKLDVYSAAGTQVNIYGGFASGFPALALIHQAANYQWNIENGREGSGVLGFYNNVAADSKMVMNLDGNVGIGTTSLQAKLTVADGTILFSGTLGSTPVSGMGTRLMWIPAKAAFRAGGVNGDMWDDANVGYASIAFGLTTKANGGSSFAMGDNTIASGSSSMAVGSRSQANGDYSVALGVDAIASGRGSVALGGSYNQTGNRADGAYSIAIGGSEYGIGPAASADYAVAIGGSDDGTGPTASGISALALGGSGTTASGAGSVAIGENVTAGIAPSTFALGKGFTNNTPNSLMVGFDSGPAFTVTVSNIGIGTTSPAAHLHLVNTDTAPTNTVRVQTAGSGTNFALRITNTYPAELLSVMDNGNVGLGLTNPGYRLAVSGDGNFSGNVTAQNFYGNIPEAGGYYAGGWTDEGTVVRLQTSSDNVGIGNSSPAAKLDVTGSLIVSGTSTTSNLTISNLTGVLKATSGAVTTANGVQHMVTRWTDANNIGTGVIYDNATNVGIGNTAPQALLDVGTAPGKGLMVLTSGNVGIGTTAPATKLSVAGEITVSGAGDSDFGGNITINSGSRYYLDNDDGKDSYLTHDNAGNLVSLFVDATMTVAFLNSGNVGIGTTAPLGLFQVGASPSVGLMVTSGGLVGIGTTNPGKTLEVYGANGMRLNLNGSDRADLYVEDTGTVLSTSAGYIDLRPGDATYGVLLRQFGDTNDWANIEVGETYVGLSKNSEQPHMVIDDAGNVGIGTSSPVGLLQVGTLPTAPGLIVLTNGNVGLGTSNPLYDLDVSGNGYFTGNVTATNFYGNIPEGGGYYAGGWTDEGTVVRLQSSSDNVGIGTSSPGSFKLQVAGNVGPDSNNMYDLGSSAMRWKHLYLACGSLHIGNDGNEAIINYDPTNNFIALDPDGDNTNAMIVKRTTGNVGIGTTNPTEKLTVTSPGNKSFQVRPGANYVSLVVDGIEVARMRQ